MNWRYHSISLRHRYAIYIETVILTWSVCVYVYEEIRMHLICYIGFCSLVFSPGIMHDCYLVFQLCDRDLWQRICLHSKWMFSLAFEIDVHLECYRSVSDDHVGFLFWTMLCTRVPATQWAVDCCVPGCPAMQWPVHHCVPGCPATQWPVGRCVPGCPATQGPVGRCAAGRPDTDTQWSDVVYPGARSRSQFEPTTMLWN